MKKTVCLLLVLVLLMGNALACIGVVCAAHGELVVRSTPDSLGNILTSMPRGTLARDMEEYYTDSRGVTWYKVDFNGAIGWVNEQFVEIEGFCGEYGEDISQTFFPSSYEYSYGIVTATGGDTNIRRWPGLEDPIEAVLRQGQSADYLDGYYIDDRGVRWNYVHYNGQFGWVSSRYTTLYTY